MSYTFLLHPPPLNDKSASNRALSTSRSSPDVNGTTNKKHARSSTVAAISTWASQITPGSPAISSASPRRTTHTPARPPPTPLVSPNFLNLVDTPTTSTSVSFVGRSFHLRSGSGSWSLTRSYHSPRSPSLRSIDISDTHAQNVLSEQGYAYVPTVFVRLPSSPSVDASQTIQEEESKENSVPPKSAVQKSFSRLKSFRMFSRLRTNSHSQGSSQVDAEASITQSIAPKSASPFVTGFHTRSKSAAVSAQPSVSKSASHSRSSKSGRPSTSQGECFEKENRDRDREKQKRHEHSSRDRFASVMPLDIAAEIQLIQLLDGGSTEESKRRVERRRAKIVEKQLNPTDIVGYSLASTAYSKSAHGSIKPGKRDIVGGGVTTAYKDEQGRLWWDEEERWENVGLLEAVGKMPTSNPPRLKKGSVASTSSSEHSGSASPLFDGEGEGGSPLSSSTSTSSAWPSRDNSAERKLRHTKRPAPLNLLKSSGHDSDADSARRAFLADSFTPFPAADSKDTTSQKGGSTKKVIDAPDRSTSLPQEKGKKPSASNLRSMFRRNASARA